MRFVKTEDLKPGMRIGRPIYNRQGVLLFDRDSKINDSVVSRIANFGLIGIFVLDPAEPAPPMSEEDIEFERFQTVNVYALADELQEIRMNQKAHKLEHISGAIVANYGHLNHKINFPQNIRSFEDFVIKHSLNVAILTAMICHQMNISIAEVSDCMLAALIHDIGKTMVPTNTLMGLDEDKIERLLEASETQGYNLFDNIFPTNPNIKRICSQANHLLLAKKYGSEIENKKTTIGAKILLVAETFDIMTAVSPAGNRQPKSLVETLRYLMDNDDVYAKNVVDALINSINVLNPGTSVELSNGTQALVLSSNPRDFLKPMVLSFVDNSIMDLSNKRMFGDIYIVDEVKTLDHRHSMDPQLLEMYGIKE